MYLGNSIITKFCFGQQNPFLVLASMDCSAEQSNGRGLGLAIYWNFQCPVRWSAVGAEHLTDFPDIIRCLSWSKVKHWVKTGSGRREWVTAYVIDLVHLADHLQLGAYLHLGPQPLYPLRVSSCEADLL